MPNNAKNTLIRRPFPRRLTTVLGSYTIAGLLCSISFSQEPLEHNKISQPEPIPFGQVIGHPNPTLSNQTSSVVGFVPSSPTTPQPIQNNNPATAQQIPSNGNIVTNGVHLSDDVLNCEECRRRLGLPPIDRSSIQRLNSHGMTAVLPIPSAIDNRSATNTLPPFTLPPSNLPTTSGTSSSSTLALTNSQASHPNVGLSGLPLEARQQLLQEISLPPGATILSAKFIDPSTVAVKPDSEPAKTSTAHIAPVAKEETINSAPVVPRVAVPETITAAPVVSNKFNLPAEPKSKTPDAGVAKEKLPTSPELSPLGPSKPAVAISNPAVVAANEDPAGSVANQNATKTVNGSPTVEMLEKVADVEVKPEQPNTASDSLVASGKELMESTTVTKETPSFMNKETATTESAIVEPVVNGPTVKPQETNSPSASDEAIAPSVSPLPSNLDFPFPAQTNEMASASTNDTSTVVSEAPKTTEELIPIAEPIEPDPANTDQRTANEVKPDKMNLVPTEKPASESQPTPSQTGSISASEVRSTPAPMDSKSLIVDGVLRSPALQQIQIDLLKKQLLERDQLIKQISEMQPQFQKQIDGLVRTNQQLVKREQELLKEVEQTKSFGQEAIQKQEMELSKLRSELANVRQQMREQLMQANDKIAESDRQKLLEISKLSNELTLAQKEKADALASLRSEMIGEALKGSKGTEKRIADQQATIATQMKSIAKLERQLESVQASQVLDARRIEKLRKELAIANSEKLNPNNKVESKSSSNSDSLDLPAPTKSYEGETLPKGADAKRNLLEDAKAISPDDSSKPFQLPVPNTKSIKPKFPRIKESVPTDEAVKEF